MFFFVYEIGVNDCELWNALLLALKRLSSEIHFEKMKGRHLMQSPLKSTPPLRIYTSKPYWSSTNTERIFYVYGFTDEVLNKVNEVKSMEEWVMYDLDNPSFYDKDACLAFTISHERLCFVQVGVSEKLKMPIDKFLAIDKVEVM